MEEVTGTADNEEEDHEEEEEEEEIESDNEDLERVDQIFPALPYDDSTDDFRPSKKRKTENVIQPNNDSPSADDSEGQTCSICLEAWSNSGNHRISSLKCGHLFGFICIKKWLESSKDGRCPQCNSLAKKRDIRVIYSKSISAVDTTERDRALKELEEEKLARILAQKSEAQAILQYQLAKVECEKLKQKLQKLKEQLMYYSNSTQENIRAAVSSTPPSSSPNCHFVPFQVVPITKDGEARVMAHNVSMDMIVVSRPSSNRLFPGWGLTKMNLLDTRSKEFIKVHDRCIRDVQFSPSGDGLIVTTSLDKTLQLTSCHSNAVVHKYSLPVPGWSCCWNVDQTEQLYCGLMNGSVLVYDIRRTDSHLTELKRGDSSVPVTSLAYLPMSHASTFNCSGILSGTLDGCVFWERSRDNFKPHLLESLSGSCTSVSFEPLTRHCLASFRPSKRNPATRHIVCQLKNLPLTEPLSCQPLHQFNGSPVCRYLSRSRLFVQPGTTDQLRVAYSNETTKKICLCDAIVDKPLQELSTENEPCLDISIINLNERDTLLASLTQHKLYLFEQQQQL